MVSTWSAWKTTLVVGLCAVGGYFLLPGAAGKDVGYSVIGLASVLAVLVGVRRHHPVERYGWYAVATGTLCFVLGDGVYDVYQFVLHRPTPFPSVADAFYLAGYPFLIIGVVRLTGGRRRKGDSRTSYADAAIVSMGALALSWHFLMGSYAHDPTMGVFAKFVTLAYPVMDLGVLFIVVRGLVFDAARSVVLRLLAAAMVSMIVADFVYDLLTLHGGYATGDMVDAGWLINYVLIGAAALHPGMVGARTPRAALGDEGGRRLPLLALAGFVPSFIVLVSALIGARTDVTALSGISVVLFALLVLRMRWMFRSIDFQTGSLKEALAARETLETELRHQAFHDNLTGLANRALLHDRVGDALASAPRSKGNVALCFCDLDRFKIVNDSLGHLVGDAMLVAAGKRLTAVVRPGDTVARLGGDEFAVLMEDVESLAVAISIAERIVSVLREPLHIDGRQIAMSVSVGVAVADWDSSTEQLLSAADSAMYEAKATGKDRITVFEASMHTRVVERLELTNAFGGALDRGEFSLFYQPQFSLGSGHLEGFEALLRWNHPTLGLILPDRFMLLAEQTGDIVPIGRWVIERACEQAAEWSLQRDAPLTVSVNLSARQLQEAHLVDDVRTALSLAGLAPSQLVFEITESLVITDPERVLAILGELKSLGVGLAIDAFGTGYSALSYLRRMPVDFLKIDKSFVERLADPTGEGAAFIATVVKLAHDLGLQTVAEGLEHAEHRQLLVNLGCDSAQGYLLARPLDHEMAGELVRSVISLSQP